MPKSGPLTYIVSDTGPIIGLCKIGKIEILESLTNKTLIPPYVYKELFGKIGFESHCIEKSLREFITVKEPEVSLPGMPDASLAELGEGERQAILLAMSFGKNALLLMDDAAGRAVARKLHISLTGLVGLLLLSKEKGVIGSITPLLENLRNKGYWLSDEIVATALELAKESKPEPRL